MTDYKIVVEVQPMLPPKPVGFAAIADGKPVAFLTEEQVRNALARFDELKAARA